jgi:thymidylate synthase (FAD)
MQVKLLDSTVDPLFVISMCARTCYNSRSKDRADTREDFIKGLIKAGHTSTLENAIATFDISGISRACQNQIVRHRIGCSYCVQSMRYVNVKDNEVIIPHKVFLELPDIVTAMNELKELYADLVNNGVPKEDARAILPLGTSTNMTMTMNFRALRHFLKLRLNKRAQAEIQQVAYFIYKICLNKWPWLVFDINYEQ